MMDTRAVGWLLFFVFDALTVASLLCVWRAMYPSPLYWSGAAVFLTLASTDLYALVTG